MTISTFSASSRSDSPILPSFPRRLSSATTTPTLPRIAEQPQIQVPPRPQCQPHAQTFLYSPTIPSPKEAPETQEGIYTFLDSASSSSCALSSSVESTSPSSTTQPSLPHEVFPSCLSLQNLGFEDEFESEKENRDDWHKGWDISTPPAEGTVGVVVKKRGPYGRLMTPEIPLIGEGEFGYYPASNTGCVKGRVTEEKDFRDGSLKVARRKLIKRNVGGGSEFGKWLRKIWTNLSFGGRR